MTFPGPIVHLSTATTWRGGEQQALYLAQGLKARGIDTLMIAPAGSPMAEECHETGMRIAEIRSRCEWDVFAMFRIALLLRRENAALIHAHDAHGVTLAAFAGRLAGTRRVCTRRVDFPIRATWKYRWGMDRTLCISDAIRTICRDAGIPEATLPVVRSGIDLDRVRKFEGDPQTVRDELFGEMKKRPLMLLNIASLTDHKGQTYLLDAMPEVIAKVKNAYLVIVGEGELQLELKKQANRLALDEHCIFTGFRDDVPLLLAAADLFVMSSHLEGLCTSVMDAAAAGLAAVACRAGGLPEVVDDNVTGLLVPPRDPKALADALIELLTNRKRRDHFAKNASQHATKHFGVETMIEGTLGVYRELLGVDPA